MQLALNAYFWNMPHTGSGQYLRQLVYHLDRMVSDLTIHLVFPQLPGQTALEAVPPTVRQTAVPTRPGHLGKLIFEQIGFPRACRELGADVIHVPYWGPPLRSPAPMVVTVHDLITLLTPQYRAGFRPRLYNALVTAATRGADAVITVSQASKQDIERHLHIPAAKISVTYEAANAAFKPGKNSLVDMAVLRKYDLPSSYVLYLGGYDLHKNVHTLLLAYTYVAQALGEDYPLVLAGKRPSKSSPYYPDYDDYIASMGLEPYIRWIGYVDEEDKPVVYRNASCFAFPSRYEGFGLPVLEALACGVPVVASNSASLPEVVGEAGFAIDPDDDRQMAGSIIAALVQEEFAEEMRQKSLTQAAKFSWEKTAAETLLVYDRVISSQ
jgi:glycosyltransferase involved in cell wall biosynthesis